MEQGIGEGFVRKCFKIQTFVVLKRPESHTQ